MLQLKAQTAAEAQVVTLPTTCRQSGSECCTSCRLWLQVVQRCCVCRQVCHLCVEKGRCWLLEKSVESEGGGAQAEAMDGAIIWLTSVCVCCWCYVVNGVCTAFADAAQSSDQFSAASGQQQQQQVAGLEAKLTAANQHITRLQLQLDVCSAEQQAVEQAAAVLREQAAGGWELLLQEVEALHSRQQLSDTARWGAGRQNEMLFLVVRMPVAAFFCMSLPSADIVE